jgi:Clostripain family
MRRISRVPRTPPPERVQAAAEALRAVQERLVVYLLAALVILVLLALALAAPALAKRGGKAGHTTTSVAAPTSAAPTSAAPASAAPSPWTFMVYLDGDNDLDPWGWYTIDLMVKGLAAGDHGSVAIPVLYDHAGATGAEQGVVTAQGYVKLADVAEPDMSSGDTLAAFIEWAMAGWPAERYVLDIWDHGSGWMYLCMDGVTQDALDGPPAGRMSIDELARGVRLGEAAAGRPVDMVLFEACDMAMVEVTYELRGLCDVTVGTQLTQDWEGIPWEKTMATLDATPSMSTMDLGKAMVDDLVWSYKVQNKDASMLGALSAIDMSGQAELVAALDGLAISLRSNMKVWQGAVGSAASVAKNQIGFGGVSGYAWFIDAYKFAAELEKQIDDAQVDACCERVKAAVSNGLYTAISKNLTNKCYGIDVAFPPNKSTYVLKSWPIWDYDGCGLDFTADTQWDELLQAYYAPSGKKH